MAVADVAPGIEPAADIVPEIEPAANALAILAPAAIVPAVDIVVEREGALPVVGEVARAARPVVRRGLPHLLWDVVLCNVCGNEAGQYKFEPAPGGRDGPSWIMRTKEPGTEDWAVRGVRFRTRRTSIVGNSPEFAQTWCQQNRACCPQVPI